MANKLFGDAGSMEEVGSRIATKVIEKVGQLKSKLNSKVNDIESVNPDASVKVINDSTDRLLEYRTRLEKRLKLDERSQEEQEVLRAKITDKLRDGFSSVKYLDKSIAEYNKSNIGSLPDSSQSSNESLIRNTAPSVVTDAITRSSDRDINQHSPDDVDYNRPADATPSSPESKVDLDNINTDREFLLKTLSAIKNSIEDPDSKNTLSDAEKNSLSDSINKIADEFFKTNNANYVELNRLVEVIQNLKDEKGDRKLRIESESDIKDSINSMYSGRLSEHIQNNLIEAIKKSSIELDLADNPAFSQFNDNIISVSKYLELLQKDGINTDPLKKLMDDAVTSVNVVNKTVSDHLSDELSRFTDAEKKSVDDLLKLHSEGNISTESLNKELKNITNKSEGIDDKDQSSRNIDDLTKLLEVIAKNTDKDGKLSNADKIMQSNRYDLELENNKLLNASLKNVNTKDDESIKTSLFKGASSAEDLGEKLGDKALDKLLGKDSSIDLSDLEGNGRERSDSRSTRGSRESSGSRSAGRSGRAGGRVGRVLSGAKSLGKSALGLGSTALSSGGLAATEAVAGGSGLLAGGSKLLSGASKAAGPLSALIAGGLAVNDYLNAESSNERVDVVAEGAGSMAGGLAGAASGAAAGAAIGSVVPVVGTAVGGLIGAAVGGFGGSEIGGSIGKWAGSFFKNVSDEIPDKIKSMGPSAEVNYIDNVMMPQLVNEVNSGKSNYSKGDIEDLKKYRNKVASKIKKPKDDPKSTPAQSTDSPVNPTPTADTPSTSTSSTSPITPVSYSSSTAELSSAIKNTPDSSRYNDILSEAEDDLIQHYTDQGMTNINELRLATGLSDDKLQNFFNRPGNPLKPSNGDIKVDNLKPIGSDKGSGSTQPIIVPAPQVVVQSGSSGSDNYRISDNTLSMASLMI